MHMPAQRGMFHLLIEQPDNGEPSPAPRISVVPKLMALLIPTYLCLIYRLVFA